ncbi:MAG: hypothetical protein U0625_04485 [Phycisphaerales bacterium]
MARQLVPQPVALAPKRLQVRGDRRLRLREHLAEQLPVPRERADLVHHHALDLLRRHRA